MRIIVLWYSFQTQNGHLGPKYYLQHFYSPDVKGRNTVNNLSISPHTRIVPPPHNQKYLSLCRSQQQYSFLVIPTISILKEEHVSIGGGMEAVTQDGKQTRGTREKASICV
ncbi:hypothetical protein AVEN_40909-1 [Araneus ventricosus]|uniref:Uncharacterized protein n=1 Tax=Araneus ventricosus TaxID=182803 RepID=A0A4Y2L4Y8_ARAVE|nr:hypothetical protein AVEN_40909-1 [Araneus ventricosus]